MSRARWLPPWLCIALALVLAGCAADTGPAGVDQPGALAHDPAGGAAVASPADAARRLQAALARAAGFPVGRLGRVCQRLPRRPLAHPQLPGCGSRQRPVQCELPRVRGRLAVRGGGGRPAR